MELHFPVSKGYINDVFLQLLLPSWIVDGSRATTENRGLGF